MGNTEHSFEFNAEIETKIYSTVTEEEFKDFSEENESLEEYARRKAKENAPRNLTRRIADDGVSKSSININDIDNHNKY